MGSSRTAISHSQRVALRDYYQTADPKPSHSALKMWFKSHFGHEISQSIVSRTLSDSFAYLDVFIPTSQAVPKFRMRSCQWPWIDLLLSDWLHVVEGLSGRVSNDAIKRRARQIWNNADESQGLAMPKFSSGWVAKFRRRNEMRHRLLPVRHHALATPTHLTSSPSHSGSVQTLEQPPIIFPPQSKATTTIIHANSNIPDSELSISTTLTFSSDHLIHLIQHNVFRALISNKSLLRTATTFLKGTNPLAFGNKSATRLCGGLTVIRPLPDHNIPDSLYPTLLQMNCVHTSWIDMFPFPKFRDNLIKKGVEFIPEEMRQDLFGDIFPDFTAQISRGNESALLSTLPSTPAISGASNDREVEIPDDYTAERRCLITWGDPWKIESWEVTPGFLKRWGWALEGCDDLIQASNRWRALRSEELIPFPQHVDNLAT
jgi:hypothetical protein